MNEKILVIGSGIAAITAIKSIREIDQNIEIHLIGDESFYPYNRVRLSKGLLSTLEEDKILLQKKDWYDLNNIRLYKNIAVISIDTDKKEVKLSDGNKMNYNKLLLANGASNVAPHILGIDKKGVFNLRTLKDSWNIKDEAKKNNRILIIGGGIQGLEIAWILSQLGKKVFLAEIFSRLMPKQLDEKSSEILKNALEVYNIEVMLNTQIKELLGDNKISGFITAKGETIDCDMVVYSTGIKPNINILENTQIKTNKGVIVNEKMETSVTDIYASGDIVEFNDEVYGLWNIAIGQGKIAGYNIVGKNSIYQQIVPVTTLNAFNLSLFSMGVIDEDKAKDILVEELENNTYQKVLINNNKIIGAIVIGDIRKSPALKIAIEKEISLSSVDIKNISIDEIIEIIRKKSK
ncbi:NAD(P)/FAD-dependent oxidoreductase [Tepidibacter mesophilus]|uniref:NAD(P)/FAD-dependent oxidoreductase n=1 Tax=Tepidibacter mesophilus TaxID=655607 RepID=UPI000C07D40E|nr:FAD-dependent oxidoreductase [Tepidibacter mesophilus]